MGKYLIQDIVPPEKKHRRVAVKRHAESEPVISHPEHPIRRKAPVHHDDGHVVLPENPRAMIVNQLEADEEDVSQMPAPRSSKVTHELVSRTAPWKTSPANDQEPAPQREPKLKEPVEYPEYPRNTRDDDARGPWLPWLIGTLIVIGVGIFLLNYFSGATITILPKRDTIPMNQKFVASKNPSQGELPYAIMVATSSLTREVPATGEKTVVSKASGKIVIYNEQTTAQRLIKNTRFQSPTGKIYRINESVTIPKATVKSGKIQPGFFEATVYADEAGPDYNSAPVDFTVPGLKGLPMYTKVYARSKGAITGGASGVTKTVSDQDLKAASEDLRVQLETKLRAKARADLAPNQLAYDTGIVVNLGEPGLSKAPASADNKALVSETGAIYLVTFKREDIVQAIMKPLVPTYAGEQVNIKNLDALQFDMGEQKGDMLLTTNKLEFTLKGTPEILWVVDDEVIKTALLGVAKSSLKDVMAKFPAVVKAKASVRPMWKSTFPEDKERMTVELVDAMP